MTVWCNENHTKDIFMFHSTRQETKALWISSDTFKTSELSSHQGGKPECFLKLWNGALILYIKMNSVGCLHTGQYTYMITLW